MSWVVTREHLGRILINGILYPRQTVTKIHSLLRIQVIDPDMLRSSILVAVLFVLNTNTRCQCISIGDSLPISVKGYTQGFLRKPIIIDFFASNCTVCFAMLPKLKEFKQKFDGKIAFLLIGKMDDRV